MGCCLMALAAALWPRLIILVLMLFTNIMERGYHDIKVIWPMLGFFFLPATTLTYGLIKAYGHPLDSPFLAVFLLAFMYDLGQLGIFRKAQRQRIFYSNTQKAKTIDQDKFVDPAP